MSADLQPVDRLVDQLQAGADQLVDQLDQPAGIVADDLVAAAQPVTPRDRGLLVQTVHASVVAGNPTLVAGGAGVDYAGFVHARQPWLTDTIVRQTDQTIDTYTTYLADVVGTIG